MYLHEVHVDYNTWLQVKLAHGKEQLPVDFPTSYHTCELLIGLDGLFFFFSTYYSILLFLKVLPIILFILPIILLLYLLFSLKVNKKLVQKKQ